jgi:PiT family inorganic phosphate transporter
MALVILCVVLILILMAEFVNGRNDACTAIATVVSTRVLSPFQAIMMAMVLNTAGALISNKAVASTVGRDLVSPEAITLLTVGSAVLTVFIWCMLANHYGIPVSTSHSLFGGLAGAGIATGGLKVLLAGGWIKVLLGLVFSTILGFVAAFLLITLIFRLFHRATPHLVRGVFGRIQILSSAFMAFSHGSNDGQKFMGVFTLALVLGGVLPSFAVPWYVTVVCSIVMGLGTSIGGWRLIRTMGVKLVRLEPHHGFAAETAAATVIEVASRLGVPLSTTHTISTAIMGVGASRRLSAVRWGVVGEVITAWLITFPVCGAMAWVVAKVLSFTPTEWWQPK